ncbi:ATP-dependent DNA ligase [Agrococcus terreus]|uniref:ATP-dependent DNA ligase n=1 Tax=Agrococcus terreus TaxID=574649 RepID=UPI003850B710
MPAAERLDIGGRVVRLSNPTKVLYPETGTTKRDVVDYYAQVADVLMAHAAGRPVTRKRWVDGVGTERKPGAVFFQKQLERGAPGWLETVDIQHSEGVKAYPLVSEPAALVWMANLAALELHVPQWRADAGFGASVDSERQHPDRLVLDLDPGEGADIDDCAEVALWVREVLVDMGLDPMPLTSGSKGIHLYARLHGTLTSRQVSDVAHELARSLEQLHPDRVVSEMRKAKRVGKVMLDWSQNSAAKTTVAPYSLRGRVRPTVAAPRTWDEIEHGHLEQLEYPEVLRRLDRDGDLIAALDAPPEADAAPARGRATASAGEAKGGAKGPATGSGSAKGSAKGAAKGRGGDGATASDRLAKYREMRDPERTPEPVPAEAPTPRDESTFVVQEHHARRLHYDFRLEQEGVLVSWAVPKGPPTTAGRNHLAVQTEDHPLEYGSFAGEIPKGEYGAGTVTIWDEGTVELEKWRDDEVIGVLHGRDDGGLGGEPYRFALIRTDADKRQWLLHRMKDQRKGAWSREARRKAERDGGAGAGAPQSDSKAAEGGKRSSKASKTVGSRATASRASASSGGRRERLRPMLASPGEPRDLDDEREWSLEVKWDGWRVLVEVDHGEVRLLSRSGGDLSASFPELLAPIASAVRTGQAVLDGEVVVLGAEGASDFGALQARAGLTGREARAAAKRSPVTLLLFDLLEVNGERILDVPLDDRHGRLDALVAPSRRVRISRPLRGSLQHVLDVTRERGLEGVIAKRRDSRYRPGARSSDWLKLKHQQMREVVVVGWLEGKGGLAGTVGSLVLARPEGRRLRYVGRVGTGFSGAERDRLRDALRPRRTAPAIDDVPADVRKRIRWVRSAVAEVEHSEETASGALRHPVWRGLRHDKRVSDL